MRLCRVLLVVVASFLTSSEGASLTSSDQSELSTVDSPHNLPLSRSLATDQHTPIDKRSLRVVLVNESDGSSTPKLNSNSNNGEERIMAFMGNTRGVFTKMKYRSWVKQGKTPKSIYKTATGLGYGRHDWAVAAGYSKYWYHQLKYGPFAVDEIKKHKKREHR